MISFIRYSSLAIVALIFAQCRDKSSGSQSVNQMDSVRNIFSDSSYSSIKILEKEEHAGVRYESKEVSYEIDYINRKHYLVKYETTTEGWSGAMSKHRLIRAELHPLDSLNQVDLVINQACDELIFLEGHYKTIRQGCCGSEDEIGLFDYENNEIVSGNGNIIYCTIPKTPIRFYLGYGGYRDSTSLGVLTFSYGSNDSYNIEFVGPPSVIKYCTEFTPEITIRSKSPNDKFNKEFNSYDFWSLTKIKSKNEINDIEILFPPYCYVPGKILPTIVIPIINGKPFGKEERFQKVQLSI